MKRNVKKKNYTRVPYFFNNAFFTVVAHIIIKTNLSQIKLANILNTTHSMISDYENTKKLIATPFLYTICKKYNISADYLLGKIDTLKYLK